nr:reverse transcriptase N-terminal domain-containing protein [Nostoc sp. SerVER01]
MTPDLPTATELGISWIKIPWKKLRKNLFRLQCRLWKAIREGDRKRANSLQKLILKSRSARLLAIRQVTQLNNGKKTAGVDGKASKTKLVSATDGFNFLGWNLKVQKNGKFRSTPSEDNYKAFRHKVKAIVNNSNYGAKIKASKLAPIVRGWRNYHRYCKMNGSKFSLWYIQNRAWKVFNHEIKLNRHQTDALIKKAFPTVPFAENKHINVKGDASPYNGDIVYWSKRKSQLYDDATSKALRKQNHTCGHCGLKFADSELIHLHHVDNNHDNWKPKNLLAVHESCHHYIHMSKR